MTETRITIPFIFPKNITGIISDALTNIPIGFRYKKFGTIKSKFFITAKNESRYFDLATTVTGIKIYQKQSPTDPTPHSLTLYGGEKSTSVSWDPRTPMHNELQTFMIRCDGLSLGKTTIDITIMSVDGFIKDIIFSRGITTKCTNKSSINIVFYVLFFIFIILMAIVTAKRKRKSVQSDSIREAAIREVESW